MVPRWRRVRSANRPETITDRPTGQRDASLSRRRRLGIHYSRKWTTTWGELRSAESMKCDRTATRWRCCCCWHYSTKTLTNGVIRRHAGLKTRSSATAKSTARPSCLVNVLYDIYRGENLLMANQPISRKWPRKLPDSAK